MVCLFVFFMSARGEPQRCTAIIEKEDEEIAIATIWIGLVSTTTITLHNSLCGLITVFTDFTRPLQTIGRFENRIKSTLLQYTIYVFIAGFISYRCDSSIISQWF